MKYHAEVLFDGHAWTASVTNADGAHTYSRTLRGLEHEIREAIVAAEDLPDDAAIEIDYDWQNTDDEIRGAVRIGEERKRLDDERRLLLVEGVLRARKLVDRGMPMRDVAQLIGVSVGRVSQILGASAEKQRERQ